MNAIFFSAVWGVVMMFAGIVTKNERTIRVLSVAGLVLLVLANTAELAGTFVIPVDTHDMLRFETFGLFFNEIAFLCTLMLFLLSGRDIDKVGLRQPEYYALIFFVLCGVSIASSFNTLLMLFLGIEIISIPLYILTGSDKRNLKSNEAALKYFLMGAFSTGLMLMGIALVYGATGSFSLETIGTATTMTPMLSAGLLLLMFSMAFKVSAAPFHFWTPDVYDGAPTVFTSFMATIVKVAAFIAFIRLFQEAFGELHDQWRMLVAIITAATLIIGNITAVFQQSVKRMLAYSSISQAGFMLFALVAMNALGREGLIFYTAAYSVATIGVFAILLKMKDYTFEGFNGLGRQQPLLAATNTIFLLSLAGIPATAGFMAKFYMLSAAVEDGKLLWLVVLGVVCAAVSVYYYFRVIQAMYFKEGEEKPLQLSRGFKSMLVVLAVVIVVMGVFPNWFSELMDYFYRVNLNSLTGH